MKVRLTKVMGGNILPDGFWVRGRGGVPKRTTNFYLTPVECITAARPPTIVGYSVTMDMFFTSIVKHVFPTDYGFLIVANDALWKWECIDPEFINDHGTWIKD